MSEVLQGSFLVDKNGAKVEIVDAAARNGINQLGQEVHSDAYKNQIVNAVLAAVPDHGAVNVTIQPGQSYSIPGGLHNGNGVVYAAESPSAGVQVATGSFTTDESGNATVNVGFKPDFVCFNAGTTVNGGASYPGFPFTASGFDSIENAHTPANPSTSVIGISVCTRTSNGFTVRMYKLSPTFEQTVEAHRTCNYTAIKYT